MAEREANPGLGFSIRHAWIVDPDGELPDHEIRVSGSTITWVGPDDGRPVSDGSHDAEGKRVLPGFIDLHAHGAVGADFRTGTVADHRRIADFHRGLGTTTMLASLSSAPPSDLLRAVSTLAETVADDMSPIAGIHLEGPFISQHHRGAHNPAAVRSGSVDELTALWAASGESLRMITFAPEAAGARRVVDFANANGVLLALGHTGATFDQAASAFDDGVRHVTHALNGMRQMDRRDPGPLPAAVDDGRVTVEIIPDGRHVHPAMMRLLLAALGGDRVVLVSDSSAATGLRDGAHHLAGRDLEVKEGVVTLSGTGTIAGSAISMAHAMRNAASFLGVDLPTVTRMTSLNPARLLGLDHRKGRVQAGFDADLVMLDAELSTASTYLSGAHHRAGSRLE